MIYLDYCATSAPFESALEAYTNINKFHFGNPSSLHFYGYESKKLLEEARNGILSLLNVAKEDNLIFTSSATEANNLVLKGIPFKYKNRGNRIITSKGEHPSVLNPLLQMKDIFGFKVDYVPLKENGEIDLDAFSSLMGDDVILVSIMGVNNETGAINPASSISKIVKKYPKCFFHSDLTQAIGKIDLDYSLFDMFSFSSHKIGGVKGNGCLVYKKKVQFVSLLSGGEQEYGLRSGTNDVASSYATYVALKETLSLLKQKKGHMLELRDYLYSKLEEIPFVSINSTKNGSPFVTSISLEKNKASVVVEGLSNKGICVSSVSACSSKGEPASYVLEAMGKTSKQAHNPIRISISFSTTKEELDTFIFELTTLLKETKNI